MYFFLSFCKYFLWNFFLFQTKKDLVAIKCFEKTKLSHSDQIENIVTEIRMLKMLRHPHIVEMIEFLWDERLVCFQMQNNRYNFDYLNEVKLLAAEVPNKNMLHYIFQHSACM